jgi:hypothetical protein
VLYLHPAAHHPQQVGDYFVIENTVVLRLKAIENFAANGHDCLKLRIPAKLT